MSRLLIVEDDIALSESVALALETAGFLVFTANTVNEAKKMLDSSDYDLLLLDVNLPDGSGHDVLAWIRHYGKDIPTIFLTANDDEADVIRALEGGGDDYVTKPFRIRELISRINANLRRYEGKRVIEPEKNEIAVFTVDEKRYEIRLRGEPLMLTPVEYRLLKRFIDAKDRVLRRDYLLDEIYDVDGSLIDDNTLSVYIKRLREKLGDDKDSIVTVRGVGYRFNPPTE